MMHMREIGFPTLPYIVWEARLQVGLRRSRVRLGVLYTVQDMYSFLFEYFSTIVLAPHAVKCRVAQAE
jgi:hypothetical protein